MFYVRQTCEVPSLDRRHQPTILRPIQKRPPHNMLQYVDFWKENSTQYWPEPGATAVTTQRHCYGNKPNDELYSQPETHDDCALVFPTPHTNTDTNREHFCSVDTARHWSDRMQRALTALDQIRARLSHMINDECARHMHAFLVAQQAAVLSLLADWTAGHNVSLERLMRDTRVAEYYTLLGHATLGLAKLDPSTP